jgi:hypothetical protein
MSSSPSAGGSSSSRIIAGGTVIGVKFDTFVMPLGHLEDFHKGLSSRFGFPHLEFEKTMEAEHCSMAGCDMSFTTRNYGIITTVRAEWGVVVPGEAPPAEHILHGRVIASVEEKLQSSEARKAGLRREEVIAVMLYTGPMYMLYNSLLRVGGGRVPPQSGSVLVRPGPPSLSLSLVSRHWRRLVVAPCVVHA